MADQTASFETIDYREENRVAWVTLDRPEVHNAFNQRMQHELRTVWRSLRDNDDVRCAVLTGAGDTAFCSGIDRTEQADDGAGDQRPPAAGGGGVAGGSALHTGASSPFTFDDPGDWIGPKSNDLWKPVVAAVNGMACGGAFYMLGEVEFVIAAEHASFFDPHVTYGMPAAYEPIHLLQKAPFGEVMRMTLLGNHERMTARRAYEIGLVSEVVPAAELTERARWAAEAIASAPPLPIEGTVRAIWAGLEHSRSHALGMAWSFIALGTSAESTRQGREDFASGRRTDWRPR
jgi:enoyl-CoA hydratase/carnithine racemase